LRLVLVVFNDVSTNQPTDWRSIVVKKSSKTPSIIPVVFLALGLTGTAANANQIRLWDSDDATHTGYSSYSSCRQGGNGECKLLTDDCGGISLYVNDWSHSHLWEDYNSGGTIHVKLLDDDGYNIRKLCALGN